MDLREVGWGSVEWIQLAQDRGRLRALVITVINLRVLAPELISYIFLTYPEFSYLIGFSKLPSLTLCS
jgi:hypothetical protein